MPCLFCLRLSRQQSSFPLRSANRRWLRYAAVFFWCGFVATSAPVAVSQVASSQTSRPFPDDVDPTAWLPDSTTAVVYLRDLGGLWDTVERSPVTERLRAFPEWKGLADSPQLQQLKSGKLFLEGLFELSLPEIIAAASSEPAIAALDRSGETALILSPSAETLERTEKILGDFAMLSGLSREGKPALRSVSYRGIPAFAADKVRIAIHGGRIVITSGNALGKTILNRALDQAASVLPNASWYQSATACWEETGIAELRLAGIVNLEALRAAGQLSMQRGKDLGQELISGGAMEVLAQAPAAVFGVDVESDRLLLRIATPLPEAVDSKWNYFFGNDLSGAAPRSCGFSDRVLSVRWHRDLSEFWNLAPQLITDENAQAEIAKSESDIATLFGGVTTVADVFGLVEPQFELVVCQPAEREASEAKSIHLPTFALVGTMRNRQQGERVLRLAFQQFVSFANLNAGPGGYPPMEVMTERVDGNTFSTAEYMELAESKDEMSRDYMGGGLYRNFSPTLAISDERLVISSDRGLAERIVETAKGTSEHKDGSEITQGTTTNSVIELWPQQLASLGELNRDVLISQRMLQTGFGRERVAAEIELFLKLAKCVEFAVAELAVVEGNLTFSLTAQAAGVGNDNPLP